MENDGRKYFIIKFNGVWDQARIKFMASGSTIGLVTDCPSGHGNACISCKYEGLRDVLKVSQ